MTNTYDLDQRLKTVEEQFLEFSYSTLQAVQSILKKNFVTDIQQQIVFGMRVGMCINTQDPYAEGRIQYFIPGPENKKVPVENLPWAWPISVLGGFDDSGALWVPPAGSHVALVFENGDKGSAYYIGTTWKRDTGPEDEKLWDYTSPEYDNIHKGHRKGYLFGLNDESQSFPPNNTDNYNIKDLDDLKAFSTDTQILKDVVPSHQYRLKTPQKHRLTFHDGNYYCNQRWKRVELGSSGGHTFMMYDDHMHPAKQFGHPNCQQRNIDGSGSSGDIKNTCHEGNDPDDPGAKPEPIEGIDCDEGEKNLFANELFKHTSECRALIGPGTPQNNTCELQQSGVFLQSISGHTFFMDDEVTEPQGIPDWERGVKAFDFGCEDKTVGKMGFISKTGHRFHIGDAEKETNIRDGNFTHPRTRRREPNGFLMVTATGHSFEMNDDTTKAGKAGQLRRIKLESTSKHLLEMVDFTNDQKSPDRKEGGQPKNDAKRAYVRLKSGYGLQLLMRDDNTQKDGAQRQFIELLSPHIRNSRKGPHILRMQEAPPGNPGLVFLRAGGVMFHHSKDEWFTQVGTSREPALRIQLVTSHDLQITRRLYIRVSELEFHIANRYILLAAGQDCTTRDGDPSPCLYPVAVCKGPFFTCPLTNFVHVGIEQFSDRVYAS